MELKHTCTNCLHWDHIDEMGQFGECWHNVSDPSVCPLTHKGDTCVLWASKLPQHRSPRAQTYREDAMISGDDEQIICDDFDA